MKNGAGEMKKGDIVVAAPHGEYGKPRPAVVVQDMDIDDIESVILCLMTSTIKNSVLRVTVEPSAQTGLQNVSQVMTDKLMTVRKAKIAKVIGRIPDDAMEKIDQALILLFGLARKKHHTLPTFG